MTNPTETTKTYTVTGMSCAHCVASVTEEVSELDGVIAVDVNLPSGRLVVDGQVDEAAVLGAVAEAGYTAELRS